MAGRGRPKSPRPAGWGKEFVLEWLEYHPGANILPFLERIAADVDGCLGGTLYQEIARWRKKDPDFREKYRALMEGRHPAANNDWSREAHLLETRPGMADWKLVAAFAYLRHKSKPIAANHAGISVSHLRNKLTQGGVDADEELIRLFDEVEQILLWAKEEDLEWAISEAKAQADARTVGQLALSVLERLDKGKWSKREEQHHVHSGTVVHQHVVEERQRQAMEAAATTSKRLFGPREEPAALPAHEEREELETEEAEYVEVEEAHAASG